MDKFGCWCGMFFHICVALFVDEYWPMGWQSESRWESEQIDRESGVRETGRCCVAAKERDARARTLPGKSQPRGYKKNK